MYFTDFRNKGHLSSLLKRQIFNHHYIYYSYTVHHWIEYQSFSKKKIQNQEEEWDNKSIRINKIANIGSKNRITIKSYTYIDLSLKYNFSITLCSSTKRENNIWSAVCHAMLKFTKYVFGYIMFRLYHISIFIFSMNFLWRAFILRSNR